MTLRLLFSLTATATTVALVGIAPALSQTLPTPTQEAPAAASTNAAPTYTLIHVSAASGSDSSGDGSQLRPYQTISHALQTATVNTILLLAAGEYSEASGERFPIQLKSGVTVQGAPGFGPGQAVIRGSGIFSSPTEGLLHTTVVGADGAGLGHVTVTNTSTSGYGLVIEAGRPVIRQNSFVGSGYGGVYVGGQSAPVIEGNQFRQNGVVGMAIAGQSTAEVRGNRFEQTGIGIRVAPGAQPQIVDNQILQNQEGIVLDGSAQPRLQDNVIAQNRRNGIVEFQTAAKAEPTLADGAAIAPPAALQPNATPALEVVAASSHPVSTATEAAESPTANASLEDVIPPPPSRSARQSHSSPPSAAETTAARSAPLVTEPPVTAREVNPATPASDQPEPETLEIAVEPPVAAEGVNPDNQPEPETLEIAVEPPVAAEGVNPADSVTALATARERLRQIRQAAAPSSTAAASPSSETGTAIPLQVIPPPMETLAGANPNRPGVNVPTQATTGSPGRPSLASASSSPASLPDPELAILQVPAGNIPVGSGGASIPNLTSGSVGAASSAGEMPPPPPPSHAAMLGLVYRVFVPAADATTQAQIRAIVGDAFRVNLNGQTMMQVGAYADQATAEAKAAEMVAQGFEARIEHNP